MQKKQEAPEGKLFLFPAILIAVLAITCIIFSISCRSQQDDTFPHQIDPNIAYCRDFTGILGTDAQGLSRYSEIFMVKHDLDFVTAVIPALNGETIENRAASFFLKWNIGKKKNGRGILVLAAQQEMALKIEVGYELEHIFTDAFCGYLARNSVRAFRNRATLFTKLNGINLAINDRINLLKDRYSDTILREWERCSFTGDSYRGSGGAGAAQFADQLVEDTSALLPEQVRALFRAGTTPQATIEIFKRSLIAIVKDPYLDIFTDATKVLRACEGWDFISNAKYLATIRHGMPMTTERHGRFAVAKPAAFYAFGWPLFLVQGKDGRWRLDEVRLIQNTILNIEGKLVVESRCDAGLDYINDPYLFAYGGSDQKVRTQQAISLILEDSDIGNDLALLKHQIAAEPGEWQHYWKMARLYLRCNAITPAWEMIEKTLELKKDDAELFEKAGDIYYDYNFMFARALLCYEQAYDLGSRSWGTLTSLGFLHGYFRRGKQAERYLKELLRKFPNAATSKSVCMYFAIAYHFQNKETLRREWELKALSQLSAATADYYQRIMN